MSTANLTTPLRGAPVRTVLHPYHIVDPSPWPLRSALTAFFLVFGLVLTRHAYTLGFALFALGLIATIANATF